MNVVREISRINQAELDIAIKNPSASWHAQYSDSAYIFIGGLPYDLTEGDVITIFSQYGEVVDVNLPRAQSNPPPSQESNRGSSAPQHQQNVVGKGKHRGFGFLMYQDQRSTVLAVDNLNGAQVLGRTLRVDHVASYKQPKMKGEDGEMLEPDSKSLNAAPPLVFAEGKEKEEEGQGEEEGDLEDPMANYFRNRREEKGKSKQSDEFEREERRRRKEERARIRAEREQRRRDARHHDDTRQEKRHRSTSRRDERSDSEEEGRGVNRYEQIKKQRSILDAPDTASRHRSRTPPSRSERDRDRESRHGDRDRRHRDDDRDKRHGSGHGHHSSSSTSRRRSRSPA